MEQNKHLYYTASSKQLTTTNTKDEDTDNTVVPQLTTKNNSIGVETENILENGSAHQKININVNHALNSKPALNLHNGDIKSPFNEQITENKPTSENITDSSKETNLKNVDKTLAKVNKSEKDSEQDESDNNDITCQVITPVKDSTEEESDNNNRSCQIKNAEKDSDQDESDNKDLARQVIKHVKDSNQDDSDNNNRACQIKKAVKDSDQDEYDNNDRTCQIIKSDENSDQYEFDNSNRECSSDTPQIDATDSVNVENIPSEENNRLLSLEENFNQYEVFTETCKYVPNIQLSKISNGPDVSQTEVNSNEKNENGFNLLKTNAENEEIHSFKNGHLQLDSTNGLDSTVHSNEAQIELNTKRLLKNIDASDSLEVKKKLTTSSWDLVSIVKLLYAIPELNPPKTISDKHKFQTEVSVLSKGAFSRYSHGSYEILIDNNNLSVMQGSENILSFSLSHADISLEAGDILRIDNKMGRTLYLKHNSKAESLQMMESLQTISFNCRQKECIELVHYPLKCYQKRIVIDLGSCSTRAGILMDESTLPTLFFPSVCATDKTTGKSEYGTEALQPSKRQNSVISFPIRPSVQIIKHNIDVEKVTGIFKKIFQQLRVDPENYTVLVCLPRSMNISAQNALVNVLLEDLNVKAVSLAHQAILTMYAHNVSTGIVVDIGDRMDIMPVIDGFIVESGVTRLPYGGQRLIHHMKHALAQKHISLSNEIDSFVVQYITENLSYIALDYEAEQDLATTHPEIVRKSVDLQSFAKDESCLQCATLEEARFKVPEGLFNPDLWGLDFPGVHKLVQKAIQAAGVDTRKKVAENIYMSGGVTLIPGFVDRLRKEITKLNEPRIKPKVFASDYRYHCTFIGACRFARMDVFPQVCVSKEEYRKNQHASLKKFALCI